MSRAKAWLAAAAAPAASAALLLAFLAGWTALHRDGSRIDIGGLDVPEPRAGGSAAVYFTIHNEGDAADELQRVVVELSGTRILGRLTDGARGIEVPAHGTVSLGPGGPDLVLGSPPRVAVGTPVAITLVFRNAGPVTVRGHVSSPGGGAVQAAGRRRSGQ